MGNAQPSVDSGVVLEAQPSGSSVRATRVGRAFSLVGIVGPLFYISLVIALGLGWQGYDPIRQTQSELGAVNAPNADLMNVAGFMGIGVTILAFAVAYLLLLRGGLAKNLAVTFLVGAGLGMVVVGFFPCDPGCVDTTRTGELHSLFSMPGAIGLPVAVMASSRAFWSDARFSAAWQVGSFWLGLAALATGPVVATELVGGVNGGFQRIAMWSPLLWVTWVSWKLRSFSDRPIRSPVPHVSTDEIVRLG